MTKLTNSATKHKPKPSDLNPWIASRKMGGSV